MKIFSSNLTILILFIFTLICQDGRAENVTVNFGVTFRNARLMPLWIADEEGYFKKQGLDIKQVNISGGTQGAQMMVSGGSMCLTMIRSPVSCLPQAACR